MKRKGFCFKRAVSLLLAVAMILTAAPQTGLTVLAAAENNDSNANDETNALEDMGIGSDTVQPEDGTAVSDGQENDGSSVRNPEESGEETGSGEGKDSENKGDVSPEDPGQEGNSDDTDDTEPGGTEEAGESTDPADEQESDEDDMADIVSDEEAVSANTLDAYLMEGVASEGEEEHKYDGEVNEDERRLIISVDEAGSEQKVIDILMARKKNNERFQCVQLDMKAANTNKVKNNRVIKKDILNAAVDVLDTTSEDYWIDYNFYNDSSNKWTNFTLNKPWGGNANINANVTMTPTEGLGVKLTFPAVNFPAEYASVNIGGDNMKDSLAANLARDGEGDYRLFTLSSGKPAGYVSEGDAWYTPAGVEESEGKDVYVGNIKSLKANTEYLMVFVADDGELAAGETKPLNAPTGWTSVSWKSYTPDIVSIDTKGNLSAWDAGEALYSVTGKEGTKSKTKFYRIWVDRGLSRMAFAEDTVAMDIGEIKYLQLYYYPSDAGCNQGNPDEITWTNENKKVIEFVKNEEGNSTGEIKALKSGTETITATYTPSLGKEKPITATCTITVKAGVNWADVNEEVEGKLYAVSGCDMKLGEVELPNDNWSWVNPNQSLAPFAGTAGHDFAAKYKTDDGFEQCMIWVRMINLKGIVMTSQQPKEENPSEMEWVEWIPGSLAEGDELTLNFDYDLENVNYENENEPENVWKKLEIKYAIEWSINSKEKLEPVGDAYKYMASILGTGKNRKAEKKTFTVSLKDKTVKKKPVVFKASHTLTVTTKPLFDWEKINDYWENRDKTGKVTSLTFMVNMPLEDYKNQKLTFASMDTSILQLNTKKITEAKPKDEEGNEISDVTEVTIPCTQKSLGRVWIKVTAPDEMKSSKLFCVEMPNMQPKILGAATQTINKASENPALDIYVTTHAQYPLIKKEDSNTFDVELTEAKINKNNLQNAFKLTVEELSGQEAAAVLSENGEFGTEPYIGLYRMTLCLKNEKLSELKTGNYTVKLKCMVQGKHEGSEPEEQTVSLTVKVADVKPKVTFKQTKKVNLFYTDDEGAGTLQVNTTEKITIVGLTDYEDKNPKKNAACHYVLEQNEENVYEIVRKKGEDGEAIKDFNASLKKGTLKYRVDGYGDTIFQTTFTVATENKAPAIVLSAKSDTLYPNVWYSDSWIFMKDKATGEEFIPDEAQYYVVKGKKKDYTPLTIGSFDALESDEEEPGESKPAWADITGSTSKNVYKLFVTDDGNIVSRLPWAEKYGKKADTINLELKKESWSKPVTVSYKLQVDSTWKPKLTLGKATLTLNKNAAVYRGQQERTTLRLKGFNDHVRGRDQDWVSITGQDEKSKKALKGKDSSLMVQYLDDEGDVIVRFNDNKIDAGTYKFRISAGIDMEDARYEYASTVLTVKIVDKAVKQSLKVTQKGSIDVLNREGTFISYTPKISNMTGIVEDGWLAGRDADMFESYFEDGKLIVKAREGTYYSTKNTYEVHTVFWVQARDWHGYEISSDNDPKAKPFKIKVKQGKPKLKATTNGNTIYRQLENRVDVRIEAMLGKQEVEIENVWLLNYRDDLTLEEYHHEDDNGGWDGGYNPETKSVKLALCSGWEMKDISKNGTYKVKFAVRYRDQAGDVKEAQVTCSIVVR